MAKKKNNPQNRLEYIFGGGRFIYIENGFLMFWFITYGAFFVVQTGFVISRSKIAMRICSTKRLDGGCLRPSTAFCWFVSDIYGHFILKTLPNNVFWNNVDHIWGCHSMAKWQISSLKSGILNRIWMVEWQPPIWSTLFQKTLFGNVLSIKSP